MTYRTITPPLVPKVVEQRMTGKYMVVSDGKYLWELGVTPYNKDVASSLGYQACHVCDFTGGPILVGPHDIGIIVVGSEEDCQWIDECQQVMMNHGCTQEGNDLIFNGCKVSGSTVTCELGNDLYLKAMSVSIDDLLPDILKVCVKRSTKTPGFLPYTQEEVLGWFE